MERAAAQRENGLKWCGALIQLCRAPMNGQLALIRRVARKQRTSTLSFLVVGAAVGAASDAPSSSARPAPAPCQSESATAGVRCRCQHDAIYVETYGKALHDEADPGTSQYSISVPLTAAPRHASGLGSGCGQRHRRRSPTVPRSPRPPPQRRHPRPQRPPPASRAPPPAAVQRPPRAC